MHESDRRVEKRRDKIRTEILTKVAEIFAQQKSISADRLDTLVRLCDYVHLTFCRGLVDPSHAKNLGLTPLSRQTRW